MSETKRTPGKWSVGTFGGQMEVIRDASKSICSMAVGNAEANAAYIVRACNSFDALVDVVERYLEADAIDHDGEEPIDDLNLSARAALSLAKGGGDCQSARNLNPYDRKDY